MGHFCHKQSAGGYRRTPVPEKAPDIAAPPARARLISIAWAMAIQMAPIVAAVPKEVPIRKDTRLFNKKVSSKNTEV